MLCVKDSRQSCKASGYVLFPSGAEDLQVSHSTSGLLWVVHLDRQNFMRESLCVYKEIDIHILLLHDGVTL